MPLGDLEVLSPCIRHIHSSLRSSWKFKVFPALKSQTRRNYRRWRRYTVLHSTTPRHCTVAVLVIVIVTVTVAVTILSLPLSLALSLPLSLSLFCYCHYHLPILSLSPSGHCHCIFTAILPSISMLLSLRLLLSMSCHCHFRSHSCCHWQATATAL